MYGYIGVQISTTHGLLGFKAKSERTVGSPVSEHHAYLGPLGPSV